jgi:hypothetical protein
LCTSKTAAAAAASVAAAAAAAAVGARRKQTQLAHMEGGSLIKLTRVIPNQRIKILLNY